MPSRGHAVNTALPTDFRKFLVVVIALVLLFGLPYLLQPIAQALLVIFAGILLAVFLDALVRLLEKVVAMPRSLALALVLLLIVGACAAFSYFAGPRIVEQTSEMVDRLPAAIDTVQQKIEDIPWIHKLLPIGQGQGQGGIPAGNELIGKVSGYFTKFFTTFFGIFANTVIILFTGIYLAFSPQVYTRSLVHLLPQNRRERGDEVLDSVGQVLRWWLVGRISSMTIVGVLTAIGLLIVGEPLALVLGLIAGLLSFIPFLGPILSALPAVIIAFSRGMNMALYVIIVFIVVQMIESNLLTPLIQRKAVMLPPAFLVVAQFLLAILVGFFGIFLATPLTVLITVLVQMLYVQDVLGDEVKILGDHGKGKR